MSDEYISDDGPGSDLFDPYETGWWKRSPSKAATPTRIRVVGYTYLVDLGPTTQPRFHIVNKQRQCSCELGAACPAVEAVTEYLRSGGQRAPDPMPPCPICGAETARDREWDGVHTKTLGWRCMAGGTSHFLQARVQRIQEALRRQQAAVSEHESAADR
jgi:hypothetical protein